MPKAVIGTQETVNKYFGEIVEVTCPVNDEPGLELRSQPGVPSHGPLPSLRTHSSPAPNLTRHPLPEENKVHTQLNFCRGGIG